MSEQFIAVSPATKDLLDICRNAAAVSSPVLLTGELGTGKKVFGRYIHNNCAGNLLPLFCYSSRTSPDVDFNKVSMEYGALFIEDVEFLSMAHQKELLDLILQKRGIKIVASTKEDLSVFVQSGRFIEDLFFRLNVFPIRVPPLRVRKEDIVPLAEKFLKDFALKYGKIIQGFSTDAVSELQKYWWPGNILELRDVVSRAVLVCRDSVIHKNDLRLFEASIDCEAVNGTSEDKSLKTALNEFKRNYVLKILDECAWNQTKAGKMLGIQRTYVSRLMNELHIRDNNK